MPKKQMEISKTAVKVPRSRAKSSGSLTKDDGIYFDDDFYR